MKIMLVVEYDGTNYIGWQRQTNGVSVQQMLEDAFFEVSGQRAAINGAGRTDAGVHALGQVAHMDTNCTIPPEKISYAMNAHLPYDIRVKSSENANDDFHARFSAKAKTYIYTYYNSEHPSAIYRNITAHVRGVLDISAMKKAAKSFCGTHDFASFCASGSDVTDTVRTVYSIDITNEKPFVRIEVTGSGFLYNMVRIIAGTLLSVGKGKISADDVEQIIADKDRNKASATAPARGLTMKKVFYTLPNEE